MPVFTPAYGLKTPAGSEITARSSYSSINFFRSSTWPLVDPKSKPSGTMMAQHPPGASDSIASPRKSSSLFLDCVGRSLRMDSADNSSRSLFFPKNPIRSKISRASCTADFIAT